MKYIATKADRTTLLDSVMIEVRVARKAKNYALVASLLDSVYWARSRKLRAEASRARSKAAKLNTEGN
jgi:hypothetical protein